MSLQESNVVELRPDRFNEFWQWYPRKVGKAYARAVFHRITTVGKKAQIKDEVALIEATPEEIIEGAKRYRRAIVDGSKCCWDDPKAVWKIDEQFIPHPGTWLNQGRFEDYE